MRKAKPERVNASLGAEAVARAKGRGDAFSEYIVLHFRVTRNLAPGCDARDFYAWYDARMRDPLEASRDPD